MKILFHHPLPLQDGGGSGSRLRPMHMLRAFEALGLDVELVTGYSKERSALISDLRKKIQSGARYAFMYSESATMPTALTDPRHLPLHPFSDFSFFRTCSDAGIPIGLFYRDIYWQFSNYNQEVAFLKASFAKIFYWYDLWKYRKYLKRLFLPSLEMGKYVPLVERKRHRALPPAHRLESPRSTYRSLKGAEHRDWVLRLFYVGGMSSHYQMHVLFEVVARISGVQLTVCTREGEWEAVRREYPDLPRNIRVIHQSGGTMEANLQVADVALLFVRPQEYRRFAAPVKLYEYLGYGKPVIASEETLAGKFVADNGVGWAIPYDHYSLEVLLYRLERRPKEIEVAARKARSTGRAHTWKSRAQTVVEELTK